MNATTETGAFAPNKYAGTCAYCQRRVKARAGCAWPKPDRTWNVGHTDCVFAAVAAGDAPSMAGSYVAPTHARALKDVRDILKTVRLDSDAAVIVDAVEKVRAILEALPRARTEGDPALEEYVEEGVPF